MQVTDAMVRAAGVAMADSVALNYDHNKAIFDRYARAALTAAMAELWRPIEEAPDNDVVLVCGFAADGYYVADAKKIDGEWMLFSCENDDFSMESSGHTHFMPLPSQPRRK